MPDHHYRRSSLYGEPERAKVPIHDRPRVLFYMGLSDVGVLARRAVVWEVFGSGGYAHFPEALHCCSAHMRDEGGIVRVGASPGRATRAAVNHGCQIHVCTAAKELASYLPRDPAGLLWVRPLPDLGRKGLRLTQGAVLHFSSLVAHRDEQGCYGCLLQRAREPACLLLRLHIVP